MKKLKLVLMALVIASFSIMQTGCYGPFKLTTKLHKWNGTLGNKYVNALVFFAFIVVPVYQVCTFIDAVVLNTIQFWTGTNPLAMNDTQKETKIVEANGQKYEITATKNRFHVEQITATADRNVVDFTYNSADQSWSMTKDNVTTKIVDFNTNKLTGQEEVKMYLPDGSTQTYSTDLAMN